MDIWRYISLAVIVGIFTVLIMMMFGKKLIRPLSVKIPRHVLLEYSRKGIVF